MINTCAITNKNEVVYNIPLQELRNSDIAWFWMDFSEPDETEVKVLTHFFHFHPLSIEDCLDNFNQRPKMDFYENYQFLVIHSLTKHDLTATEIDLFVSQEWFVTFRKSGIPELETLWDSMEKSETLRKGPFFLMHALIDVIVDEYFPLVYKIEGELNSIEDNTKDKTVTKLIDQLFDVRTDLSQLRRTILPMRDLLYRMISSERLSYLQEQHLYFHDVYDHLLKLTELLESYRDFSSDIRDSYLSVNSNTMNTTIMTLTVITTIFMPLTFIAGVYGMNFDNMPELHWDYGYFIVLGVMGGIALTMFGYFMRKGWLYTGRKRRKKNR